MKFPKLMPLIIVTSVVSIFVVAGGFAVKKTEASYQIAKLEAKMEIKEDKVETKEVETETSKISNISEEEITLMNSLYEKNNEFVGIIKGISFEYPIYMSQKEDPYKYLHVDASNNKSIAGSIFEDVLSQDNKVILWGHHMKNGMFKFVDEMATNKEAFQKYSDMTYISYNGGNPVKYTLKAKYSFTGKDDENSHPTNPDFMQGKKITNGEVSNIDNQLILGTCNYSYNTAGHSFVVCEIIEE